MGAFSVAKLLCALLLSVLGLASWAGDAAPGDLQELLSRKRLVVAMLSYDLPPFIFAGPGGKLSGHDVKIAEGIAAELGVELSIDRSAKTFNEIVDVVASGKADIGISKLSRTLLRSKRVLFSEPYLALHKALLLNRLELAKRKAGRSLPEFVKSLTGDLGVIGGSSYEEFAKAMFPKASIKPFQDWDAILKAVDKGEILGAFRDDLEVKKGMRAIPDASLRLESVVFRDSEDPIAMAVAPGRVHLLYWLNSYIKDKRLSIGVDELLALDQGGAAKPKAAEARNGSK